MDGSSRNYGDLALMPGLSGEFTTGNLALYIGPMFDIGKSINLSTGLVQNYLFNPELKTPNGSLAYLSPQESVMSRSRILITFSLSSSSIF
jgi:hypothetical protein